MELPEAFKAYFLLNATNMTDTNEMLARTTCGELTSKMNYGHITKKDV